ncbi:MAG: nickel-dependent lactate racemase [Anaerolineae bacterium]|jgi:nickel-dependent lactate racemase|nr:nickel-dependent lactate racemase [Anaerolineae bacterium]MDH7475549.1 nickel-dependent lactate racemase [Anaerolineae bacterium]
MEQEILLPYGAGTLQFRIPRANLTGIYSPSPVIACADPEMEVVRALAHPLDTPPLSDLVHPREKIIILLDDHTRATPVAQILLLLLAELRAGGVKDENITLLITHGTHRLSSEEEVRRKVGDEAYRRFRIVQHQCTDEENQVYLGLTSRGTPVWVNRLVVEADRRIGIGHIGPSPYAGYSGGNKLLLPGVAALDTINANHSLVVLGFRQPGRVDVPCRLDIEEAGEMLGLHMVVDVVLGQDERIVRAFAGTPARVFQEGLTLARHAYEVVCPGEVDVAITSAYPYDMDLYQAVRAVEYADAVVREGGSILLVAACPEGIGDQGFYSLMADRTKKPDDFLRDIVRRNGLVTFSVLGYCLARIKAEKKLYIVTEGIPDAALEAMGFHHLISLQAGVDALLGEYGSQAQVAVFPMGSSTIPVVR